MELEIVTAVGAIEWESLVGVDDVLSCRGGGNGAGGVVFMK